MSKRTFSLGDLVTAAYDSAEMLAIDQGRAPRLVALTVTKLLTDNANQRVLTKLKATR